MTGKGKTLEERERMGAMAIVDLRIEIDRIRALHHDDASAPLGSAQQRLSAMLAEHAPLPGQPDRITKMADVMYQVVKTLEPFNGKDRKRILSELRQKYVSKGQLGAQDVLDRHIDALKGERDELGSQILGEVRSQFLKHGKDAALEVMRESGLGPELIAQMQHDLDVVRLNKERPRYVRQLEWIEKTWGAVPLADWLGTERHKALVAGIEPEVSVERFITEVLAEIAGHRAWSAAWETEALRKEMMEETVPMMAATLDWTRAGCPIFSLTDDFFHALAVTDFGTNEDDKDDVLHMPFPAFVVNFPPNALLDDARRMFVYRVGRLADGRVEWPATRISLASSGNGLLTQWPSGISRWDFFHDKRLNAPDDLGMARRILANMLSYIEANHGLPAQKHKHGAEAMPVEREHTEPRFRVGRTVKLAPQIRALLKEGRQGKSWKLGHRFIVRGHWRNQAHGPQRSLRMRKWIEPFWKGAASLDEAFERTYSVE